MLLLVDGQSISLTESVAVSTNELGDYSASLLIGSYNTGTLINGSLDEFRITKGKARTQNEIYQEIVGGNLNKTAGTIAFWVKPEGWAGNDNAPHMFYEASLVDANTNDAPFIRIGKDANNSLFFNMNNGTDSYTKLLLHMDGGNGSTTFTDSSSSLTPKTVTANGQVYTDTRQSKFGGSSGLFDGTGDYITYADSADWTYSTNPFTIDFWVRFNDLTNNQGFYEQRADSSNYFAIAWQQSTSRVYFDYTVSAGGELRAYSAWTPSTNTWYHVAIIRNGATSLLLGIDGTVTAMTVYYDLGGNLNDISAVLKIGDATGTYSYGVNGWLDEFRVSKGIARWTANFEAPTMPYPITSTILFPAVNWTANEWKHIAATWDSANMKLYLNGSQASSTTAPAALNSVNLSSSMYIGSNAVSKDTCNCSIDDFAIYNYPKTSPKAKGYTNNTGEAIASAAGRYIEARAIFGTKDVEKTVTLGTIIITAEDRIYWVTPAYEGTTTITGNTLPLNVNFTDTSTHIYDVECNITDSGGTQKWGIYFPQSYVLENTTFNITTNVDTSSWAEGNYSVTCRYRDI
jgi:hypothetical protein